MVHAAAKGPGHKCVGARRHSYDHICRSTIDTLRYLAYPRVLV